MPTPNQLQEVDWVYFLFLRDMSRAPFYGVPIYQTEFGIFNRVWYILQFYTTSKMATSKQEQTYGKIVEYYSYADRLVKAVEDDAHELSSEQFSVIEEVVIRLEECADQLTSQYIEFIKNGESDKVIESVRTSLNNIMSKLEECRNKVLIMHENNTPKNPS